MTYDAQWFWIVIMHCLLFGTPDQAIAASGSENIAAPSSVPSAAEVPGLFVQQVRVLGNTVLSNKTIADIVAPFIGRFLTADDLETIRYRLTQAYISRGYVNSGVILPDQTVENGVVSYRAIEGKLTGIDITGTTWLSPDYVRSRLKRGVKSPLNTFDIEHSIQIVLQDPNIAQVNADLVPDAANGEAHLRAAVTEAKRYSLVASIANDEPPDVGSVHGELNGVVRDLTRLGDTLQLRYGRTYGVNEGGVAWTMPITAADTAVTLRWDYNGAGVISNAFRDLNIGSTLVTYSAAISQPLYRAPQQTLMLTVSLDDRASDTFLLNQPFSFTPGYSDGHARATILRAAVDWIDRDPRQVLALRSTISRGLPLFGATRTIRQPDPDFTVWLGQAQYVCAINEAQIIVRGATQLSTAPLFPFEELSIGGPDTVRGYPVNTLLTDNGVLFSLEARVPIAHFQLPYVKNGDSILQIAPFFDFGSGWNTGQPTPSVNTLSSIGVGLVWKLGERFSAEIYYGHGIQHIRNLGHSLQEDGIYFRVATTVF